MSIGHNHEARSTNFIFTIGFETAVSFAVQSSNLSDVTLSTTPFPSGPRDIMLPSNKIEQSQVIFDMIISDDYNEWITIYKWMMSCKNHNGNVIDKIKTCTLTQLDSQNQESVSFVYMDAFPVELEGVQYAINDTGSNVLTSSVTLQFNRFKIILPNGEEIDESYTG